MNSKELNILQAEAAHQKSKYDNLNKAFTKSKTSKEDTVVLYNSSDSESSPSSESDNSSNEAGKPQSTMVQIPLTMTKEAAVPSAARITIDSTVAEMNL